MAQGDSGCSGGGRTAALISVGRLGPASARIERAPPTAAAEARRGAESQRRRSSIVLTLPLGPVWNIPAV